MLLKCGRGLMCRRGRHKVEHADLLRPAAASFGVGERMG
jgi:hypothetical protein